MSALVNDVTTSQNRAIFKHLNMVGPITAKMAIDLYGCYRLSARILDLKKRGFNIHSKTIQFTNRNGHRGRCAEYSLIKEN